MSRNIRENQIQSRSEVLKKIGQSNEMKEKFEALNEAFKERLLEFCEGARGIPLTYDPFFKKIFSPEEHPERLSRLLSLLLGEQVTVRRVLLNEGSRILEEGTLLIMDVVVELEDGSIANVEIQKIAYLFPGERAACYSSDLVMRQYSKVRTEKGKKFSYKDLKKVYTIVFWNAVEQSSKRLINLSYINSDSSQILDYKWICCRNICLCHLTSFVK